MLAACAIDSFSLGVSPISWRVYISASTFVLLIYNLHPLVKSHFGGYENQPETLSSIRKNRFCHLGIALISATVCLVAGFQLVVNYWAVIMLPGSIAFAYTLPIIPWTKRWLSLREIPMAKGFLVALVWSYVTVILPILVADRTEVLVNTQLWLFYIAQFLIFYVITGLTDIRDVNVDPPRLRTIPQLLGRNRSLNLYLILCFTSVMLNLYSWHVGLLATTKVYGFFLGSIFLSAFIVKSRKQQSSWFYALLVDGMLIIQWLFCFIFQLFLS